MYLQYPLQKESGYIYRCWKYTFSVICLVF